MMMANREKIIDDAISELKKNGFVASGNLYVKQYNLNTGKFEPVTKDYLLKSFESVQPSLMKIELGAMAIMEKLPNVDGSRLRDYENCKMLIGEPFPTVEFEKKKSKFLDTNESRKKPISSNTIIRKLEDAIQYLINNNFFTDGKQFYKFDDPNFKPVHPQELLRSLNKQGVRYIGLFTEVNVLKSAFDYLTYIKEIKDLIYREIQIKALKDSEIKNYKYVCELIDLYENGDR